MGFIEGEGSFVDSPRRASKTDPKYYPRFVFTITQKELSVLERTKIFLGDKNIDSKIQPSNGEYFLRVETKESLFNLCKFLDLQEWCSDNKFRQYQKWKVKIIKWFESGYNKRQY